MHVGSRNENVTLYIFMYMNPCVNGYVSIHLVAKAVIRVIIVDTGGEKGRNSVQHFI